MLHLYHHLINSVEHTLTGAKREREKLTMWYMAAVGMTGVRPGAGPRISMMVTAFLLKRKRFFWW